MIYSIQPRSKRTIHLLVIGNYPPDLLASIASLGDAAQFQIEFSQAEIVAEIEAALRSRQWSFILCDYALWATNPETFKQQLGLSQAPWLIIYDSIAIRDVVDLMRLGVRGCVAKADQHYLAEIIRQELARIPQVEGRDTDIAQRQHPELTLHEYEARQNALLNAMPDLVFRIQSDGTILEFHGATKDLIVPPDKIVGANILEQWMALDSNKSNLAQAQQALQHVLSTQQLVVYEITIPNLHNYEVRLIPIGDSNEIIVIARDITEQKYAEIALKTSEARYRNIVEDQTDLVCRYNNDLKLTFANRAYCIYWGIGADEIIGRSILEKIPNGLRDEATAYVRSLTKANPVATSIHQSVQEDGTSRLIEWKDRAIFDDNGNVLEYQGTGRDIHEQRRQSVFQRHITEAFELLEQDAPLQQILQKLIGAVEEFEPDVFTTVLRLDQATQRLYHLASSRLPSSYNDAINGLLIGPEVGSCGTAAYHKQLVVVENIQTDKLWKEFRELAATHGLQACWSKPLLGENNLVFGTFAFYYKQPRNPSIAELEVVELVTHVAELCIRRTQSQEQLTRSEKRYRQMFELHGLPKLLINPQTGLIVNANQAASTYYGISVNDFKAITIFDINISPVEYVKEKMDAALQSRLFSSQFQHRTAGGAIRDVEMFAGPIEYDGETLVFSIVTDITEKVATETALATLNLELEQRVLDRTAEVERMTDRISAIVNHSGDPFVLLDINDGVKQVNPAFEQCFIVENDSASATRFSAYFDPTETNRLESAIKSVAADHKALRIEAKARRTDGSVFDAELNMAPVNRSTRPVTQLVCILRDVSERNRTQRAVAEERNLLRTVIDAVPDFIYVKDRQHRMVLNNVAHARSLGGIGTEVVIGRTDFDSFPVEMAEKFYADEQRLFSLELPILSTEERSIGQDGSEIWALTSKVPLRNLQGEIVGLVGITHDMTTTRRREEALRRSEQQLSESRKMLQLVLDTIPVRVFWKDLDSTYLGCNRLFANDAGFATTAEIIGKRDRDLPWLAEEAEHYCLNDMEVMHSGLPQLDYEETQKNADGDHLILRTNKLPLRDAADQIIGVLGSYIDITQHKQAEAALAQKQQTEREMQAYLSALHNISIRLTRIETLDAFYRATVEEGLKHFGFERFGFLLYDHSEGRAIGTYGTDANGNVVPEHSLRIAPTSLTGILKRTLDRTERFAFDADAQLFSNLEPIGIGQNAVAALWNGDVLGWLTVDNGVRHQSITKSQLEILALYALTIGSLLARKQAEFALRDSEEKYHRIVELSEECILLTDSEARVTYFNPKWYQITNLPEAETVGRPYFEFMAPSFQEETKQRFEDQKRGASAKVDTQIVQKDGSYFWVSVASTPVFSETGDFLGILAMFMDIDKRKRAEIAVAESEERLRILFETSPDTIVLTGLDGTVIDVNNAGTELVGLPRGEIVGKNVTTLNLFQSPSEVTDVKAGLALTMVGKGRRSEYKLQKSDGLPVFIEALTHPIQIAEKPMQLAVVRDITSRREAEAALRESEERYRLIADNVSDVIIKYNLDGICTYVSPSVRLSLGYSPDEISGHTLSEFLHPDDVTSTGAVSLEAITTGKLEFRVTHRILAKDGRYIWSESSNTLIYDSNAQLLGGVAVFRDISQRKEIEDALRTSEDRFRRFIESAPVAVVVVNRDGTVALANREAETLFGYKKDELTKLAVETLVPETSRQVHVNYRTNYMSVPEVRRQSSLELAGLRKNGDVFPAEIKLSYVDLPEGAVALAYIVDITRRKQAEQALQHALAQEKELGELKSRFVSMASHEFRTPLATIYATTDTLSNFRHKLPEEQIEQKLVKIRRQVGHMKEIIEDVLEIARFQAGRMEFKPVQADLDALCREIAEEFDSQTPYRGRILYQSNLAPINRMHDIHLMRQVISNLVSNALKYSPDRPPVHLIVNVDSEQTIIEVKDEGIGIPPDDLNRLFEPFHRANNVGTISGTGLGLSIIKHAVELHGGSITVDSHLGVGTTFKVKIPLSLKADSVV